MGDALNDLCLLVAVLLALLPLPPLIALGENGCLMLQCERCRECASPFFAWCAALLPLPLRSVVCFDEVVRARRPAACSSMLLFAVV